ncbi:MAG: tetratricopeptide repeat protein [Bacteroidales bacterium]
MRLFIVLLLLILHGQAFAQQAEIDSLERLLQAAPTPGLQEQATILSGLSRRYLRVSPQQSVTYGKRALEIMEKMQNPEGMAAVAKTLGTAYFMQSDFATALEYFNMALRKNIETNNTNELAASYNNIGVVYNRLGYYDLALSNHLQQLKINEETGNLKGIAISNSNIGNIYNNMKENDKALAYYKEAYRITQQLQDSDAMANSLINLGVASMEIQDYPRAIEYFNQALKMKKPLGDQINIGVIYSNLGLVYRSLEEYEKALGFFNQSLEISRLANNKQGIAVALTNLGDLYMKLGRYEKSRGLLLEALEIASNIESNKLVMDIYRHLSMWYENRGQYERSLEYYKQMASLKDSILDTEKSRHIRNLQIVYEVEKKEKEILEQRISIEKLQANQFYLLLAIVVALALAFVVYYRYRTKKRLNRELEVKVAAALQKQKEQQQIIVHQASLTSLGELAAGIAHEIKQPLQNISLANESLQMELTEENPEKSFIEENIGNIHEDIKRIKFIINEISNFSRGQQEQIEEYFDMNTRIENAFSLARTNFANRRITVDFRLDKHLPRLKGNPYKFEQVVVNFFNNAQDAVEEKAEKTGKQYEKRIEVRSFADKDFIFMEVKDNGIGVPDDIKTNIFLPFYTTKQLGKGTGLGLSISLGIAKEMGGFIEIESEHMQGTTMRLKIPHREKDNLRDHTLMTS